MQVLISDSVGGMVVLADRQSTIFDWPADTKNFLMDGVYFDH